MHEFKTVHLGEICFEAKNENPSLHDKDIIYIDISSIDSHNKRITSYNVINSTEAPSRARQKVQLGDIIVSTVRPNLNAVAMIDHESAELIASTGFCVLRPDKNRVNSRYLFEFVKSPYFVNSMTQQATGASYPAVSNHIVKSEQLILPPLDVQQKIADVLDKASALIELRKAQIEKLDLLVKSQFIEMFGDPVTNPMGWEIGTIRDLVTDVKYGTSKPAEENGQYVYLRMNNITYDGHIDLSALKYINVPDKDYEKYVVRKGDILFNRTNSRELVGKTAVFDEDTPMIIAGYIIRIRTNEGANPEYISAYLNSGFGKKMLFDICKAIVGQANINAQELQDISIPIIPIALQNDFADFVEQVEGQKKQLKQSLEDMELNYKSLMQKCFRGEIF